jgi:hypothetical protein
MIAADNPMARLRTSIPTGTQHYNAPQPVEFLRRFRSQ